ncbi:MAG: YjfB family protein [Syntrophomonadaceae bacterium]
MDIAAVSIGLKQVQLAQAASTSILKKAMDNAQVQAQDLLKIMEQSIQPQLGANVDLTG